MNVYISRHARNKLKKLLKGNPKLSDQLDQKLKLFLGQPTHPSLRLHKLTGRKLQEWSISIDEDLRLIFQYVEDGILVVDLGSHDKVY
jgi:addiction module RelE/StbE family toxin